MQANLVVEIIGLAFEAVDAFVRVDLAERMDLLSTPARIGRRRISLDLPERGYDQLTQHKNDHERLLDELRDIMEDFEENSRIDENMLARRLDAWFSRHFESHDARLHSALGEH